MWGINGFKKVKLGGYMAQVMAVVSFLVANKALILGAGWAICEVLCKVPNVESNSVFELVQNGIKKLMTPAA